MNLSTMKINVQSNQSNDLGGGQVTWVEFDLEGSGLTFWIFQDGVSFFPPLLRT